MTAARICALIVATLDGVALPEQPTSLLYTYGARANDIQLVPSPTRTTILLDGLAGRRWFDITVREIRPTDDPAVAMLYDPEILAALIHRAGYPPDTPSG